jgi:hypothetical protein
VPPAAAQEVAGLVGGLAHEDVVQHLDAGVPELPVPDNFKQVFLDWAAGKSTSSLLVWIGITSDCFVVC